jgi:hypothetical protein
MKWEQWAVLSGFMKSLGPGNNGNLRWVANSRHDARPAGEKTAGALGRDRMVDGHASGRWQLPTSTYVCDLSSQWMSCMDHIHIFSSPTAAT